MWLKRVKKSMMVRMETMSGSLTNQINVIERDRQPIFLGGCYHASCEVRRNFLALQFAVADISLGHSDGGRKLSLRHAKLLSNRFEIVLHGDILAPLFERVNSASSCRK